MPFSITQNRNYTPPPTGNLPTFFASTTFDGTKAAGFTPSAPPTTRNNPVPAAFTGDKEQFNGNKNTGRTKSATASFVAHLLGH